MLNLLGLFWNGTVLQLYNYYLEKYPYALHLRTLESNQTCRLLRKLMTDLEDKTIHLEVF